MTSDTGLLGIDRPAVEAWIGEHVDELRGPFTWTQLVGGHSNLTYRIDPSSGPAAVVRRPPLGELQPKAHDMSREYMIISGLWGTGVPVARPYALCSDPAVTGAPFYVMAFVEGSPLGAAGDASTWLTEPLRRTAGFSFPETLAKLHNVDPLDPDRHLADLGRHDGYAARQLKAWYRSWVTSAPDAGLDDPRAHSLHDLLQAHLPDDGPVKVVHGDFAIHNSLVGDDGRITAVLDWEVATLGDPMADLAYLLNSWIEADEVDTRGPAPTALPGFPTRAELVERYLEVRPDADLTNLAYFQVLNFWRSACIVHGVYTRYVRGQKSTEGVDLQRFIDSAMRSLAAAESAATALTGGADHVR
jgi:aminoglycoside phosphotransferase (APT) family kinase protein